MTDGNFWGECEFCGSKLVQKENPGKGKPLILCEECEKEREQENAE